jgi:succinate dehydrogenase / fumarate reductase cytochrome b subunit
MTDTPSAKISRPRPLSPHLQVYRLPLSALTSIAHRLSGVVLTGGAFFLVAFIWAAAFSPACFDGMKSFFNTMLGLLLLSGWTLALYYHLCAGIRHLSWDAGFGFAKPTFKFTNWVVIGAALVLTVCTLAITCPYFKGI